MRSYFTNRVMVINGAADEPDVVEGLNFLEEIKCGITRVGVREGSDPRQEIIETRHIPIRICL